MFEFSPKALELRERLLAFMEEYIYPNEATFRDELAAGPRWQPPRILETLKAKAKAAGLWNLFLPDSEYGPGLSNLDYAPLCEIMGRSFLAPEVFNCSAPDTGNMEVLVRYGTPEQKKAVARTTSGWRNSVVLCHDRTRRSKFRRHQHRCAYRA